MDNKIAFYNPDPPKFTGFFYNFCKFPVTSFVTPCQNKRNNGYESVTYVFRGG